MTYELAKQLKDAGFHQPEPDEIMRGNYFPNDASGFYYEEAYEPSLSELIEACGGNLVALTKGNMWAAHSIDMYIAEGLTPEEAVAKLYIALKQKITWTNVN